MWSRSVIWFGLGREEAWDLPLREFFALAAVRREDERVLDYRAGVIASSMSGQPIEELFPSLRPRRMSVDETVDYMREFVLAIGGEVREA